jgi:hypothetical protein
VTYLRSKMSIKSTHLVIPVAFPVILSQMKKSYKLNLKQRNIPHAGKVMHNSLTTSIGGHAEDFLMLHNGSWK